MKNKFFLVFLFLLFIVFSFWGGINVGRITTFQTKYILPPKFENKEIIKGDFSIFWESLKVLKEKYYDPQIIDDQALIYGAINGALGSLKDPYTVFLSPDENQKFTEELSGVFGGIGAELDIRNNQLIIVAPLKNTPAEKAGLKPGDRIIKINETSTENINIEKAVKLIRGEVGTKVKLDILREGWEEPKTFEITRALIKIPSLEWKILDNNIAYIALYNFYSTVPIDFYSAMANILLTQNPKGLILDLRNNPGGFLDVSINIAGWFLKRGDVVVIEKERGNKIQKLYAYGNEALLNLPVVILVNKGTASASEILAGALRDNRNIKIIGEQTFGKGSVQEIKNLQNNAALKITIAEWLTPRGTKINNIGIKPDFEVKFEKENNKENQKDNQL
jgi:carboxyl-terminal processing protease